MPGFIYLVSFAMNSSLYVLCSLLLIGLIACQSKPKPKLSSKGLPERPNIIFIMTDDHAYQAISAYGSQLIKTPNIDRLAATGMRFDRAFVSNSICAPSRAVILTGTHSHINGVLDNVLPFDSSKTIYPQILQDSGYQTAMIGKWHLKSEPRGFDYWKILPGQGHYYNPDWRTPEGKTQDEGYVTDLITDEAIDWLEEGRDPDAPFLLVYQHKAPHREWMPGPAHLGDLVGEDFPMPDTYFDAYAGRGQAAKEQEMSVIEDMSYTHDHKIPPYIMRELGLQGPGWYDGAYHNEQGRMTDAQRAAWSEVYDPIIAELEAQWPLSDSALARWKYQRYLEDYLGTIQSVDDNVGRLLDYLEAHGLRENTLIVYTSDQGFYLGEHGWFDKRMMYEESFRTPLLVSWPGVIEPGSVNEDLVQNLDFAQTLLGAAGVTAPAYMQGQSLIPLLQGQSVPWRDALYYHYYEYPGAHMVKRHYGVRTDRYKLIHFYDDVDEWELYDLDQDPQEMQSVYGRPAYAEVQAQLHQRLRALQAQYQDPIESELAKR
jgi:arylsulfatase A-like enzyme